MTTKEVSIITGYPEQAIRLMAQQGVLPGAIAYKGVGKKWVYQYNERKLKEEFGYEKSN